MFANPGVEMACWRYLREPNLADEEPGAADEIVLLLLRKRIQTGNACRTPSLYGSPSCSCYVKAMLRGQSHESHERSSAAPKDEGWCKATTVWGSGKNARPTRPL